MSIPRSAWWWQKDDDGVPLLQKRLDECGSYARVVGAYGGVRGTLMHAGRELGVKAPLKQGQKQKPGQGIHKDRHRAEPPGIRQRSDRATITDEIRRLPDGPVSDDELMRAHDLNPDEWVRDRLTVNSWEAIDGEGNIVKLAQTKLSLKRRVPIDFVPPTPKPAGWKPKPPLNITRKKRANQADQPRMIPILSDPHAPLHEPLACEAVTQFLHEHADVIDQVICLGDASDNSPWGRHRAIPRTDSTPTEASQATYDLLAEWRAPVAHVPFKLIPGNHDWWIWQRLRERYPMLENWHFPNEDLPALHPRNSLKLDELGIDFVDAPGGEYHDATVTVLPNLVVMHGTLTGPMGGAVKEITGWEATSVIQGHDHKLTAVLIVKRRPDGTEVSHWAISAGTLALRDLGYDPKKNCAQGFIVLHVWGDGTWAPVAARFDPQTGVTTCGAWRYDPAA